MKPNINKAQLLAFNPCSDGTAFLNKHKTLKAAWLKCNNPDWMIWALSKCGLFDDVTARRFAIVCAEHTLHFFEDDYPNDKRPRQAIEAAKGFIVGTVNAEQLDAAWAAARDAAWAAARDARDAAWAATRAAARDARDARDAAWAAARDAAWAAESKWQSNQLRKLINPFHE